MLMNDRNYVLQLTRVEVCDLLLSCLAASELSDGAKKWDVLHEKIMKQLDTLDALNADE